MARYTLTIPPPENAETYGSLKWIFTDEPASAFCSGKPGIKIWHGKSKKPKWYVFRSAEHRSQYLERVKAEEDADAALRAKHKAEKEKRLAAMLEQIHPGTVLHYSWGYDQTNCEFFQVLTRSGRKITMREIQAITVPGSEGFMCDRRIPKTDAFVDGAPVLTKIIGAYGAPMDFGSASPVEDGHSFSCSWYA